MVNRVIKGDFSGGVNNETDRDPAGWTLIGETNQYQIVADHELAEYQGWLAFNTFGSPARSQIRQTVTGVDIGDEITFSFDFKEVGNGASERVSFQYTIVDDLNNVILQNTVSSSSNAYETPVENVSHSFIAESSSYTIVFYDNSSNANAQNRDILLDNVTFDVPCFCHGTLIETDRGPIPVEDIKAGDLIRTRDNGLQPVRWINSRELTDVELGAAPSLYPIRIQAGALGRGTPNSTLLVSPQHRVLVRSAIAQRMFGTEEVLVAAKHLCAIEGIEIAADIASVRYFHLLFDRHEVIYSNGAETESLYTGEQALKSVGPAAYEEIFALFPELRNQTPENLPLPVRPLVPGRAARQLAARHARNNKWLVA